MYILGGHILISIISIYLLILLILMLQIHAQPQSDRLSVKNSVHFDFGDFITSDHCTAQHSIWFLPLETNKAIKTCNLMYLRQNKFTGLSSHTVTYIVFSSGHSFILCGFSITSAQRCTCLWCAVTLSSCTLFKIPGPFFLLLLSSFTHPCGVQSFQSHETQTEKFL